MMNGMVYAYPDAYPLPFAKCFFQTSKKSAIWSSTTVSVSSGTTAHFMLPPFYIKTIAEHTSIPVPKVFNLYYYDDNLYIERGYVHEISLEAAWYRSHLSQDQKKYIITEAAGYINQLRGLEPPREGIFISQ